RARRERCVHRFESEPPRASAREDEQQEARDLGGQKCACNNRMPPFEQRPHPAQIGESSEDGENHEPLRAEAPAPVALVTEPAILNGFGREELDQERADRRNVAEPHKLSWSTSVR